ncbi:MAG: zinc ABC transporter substrate-binding protein [Deltaproteobacteria bacterium]|nr:zinc ABC transporter substrate-binding protein [Deltaproteobacteria bacterium]
MKKITATVIALGLLSVSTVHAADKLRVGVTLHPYYSWVANIAGDAVEIVPAVPPGSDPHSYQPQPQDIARLAKLDAIVVNGSGHDDFIEPMLKAANSTHLVRIEPNAGLPLIPVQQKHYAFEEKVDKGQVAYNSHTFVSINASIQQIRAVADALAKLRPEDAKQFQSNARAYVKKLRTMLAAALARIEKVKGQHPAIATVHDGYAYLFQDLGLEVTAVVQPRHGIEPSARQLADTIKRVKEAKVAILFTEADYAKKYTDAIYEETGCRLYALSHISGGGYTADRFEKDMRRNVDTIARALEEAAR